MRGFTLIEVMIALVISMVALLAIGSFTVSMMNQGQIARERLAAVHLAESLLEEWQHDGKDYFPNVKADCSTQPRTAMPTYPVTVSCTPATARTNFTVQALEQSAEGPMPPAPLKIGTFAKVDPYTVTPKVKVVKVSWYHKPTGNAQKDKSRFHSVFLTHVSAVK